MAKFTKEVCCQKCNLQTNLFRFLSASELEEINKSRYEVHFKKGETIYKQSGPLTHIACVTEGLAKVYLEGENNKNIILKILTSTELVGGPGFQLDNRHHFSVSAITEMSACFIDINAFEKVLRQNIDFNLEFIKHLNTATVHMYNKLIGLTGKNMHGRIADALLYLSSSIYKNATFETTLSRQDLADLAALTKESSIRILKEFKDEGIIEFESNSFHIKNMDKLISISRNS